jgi:hypothetical protein
MTGPGGGEYPRVAHPRSCSGPIACSNEGWLAAVVRAGRLRRPTAVAAPVDGARASCEFLQLSIRLLLPESYVHLVVHRRRGGEALPRLLLARTAMELAEAETLGCYLPMLRPGVRAHTHQETSASLSVRSMRSIPASTGSYVLFAMIEARKGREE